MSEIAVRHTREECFAHTNDWKKPYDGNIFDMFKNGSFELIDLSNPFGRGNPPGTTGLGAQYRKCRNSQSSGRRYFCMSQVHRP